MSHTTCNCCTLCNQSNPCDGTLAGGLCDDMCDCEELDRLDSQECVSCGDDCILGESYCDQCQIQGRG